LTEHSEQVISLVPKDLANSEVDTAKTKTRIIGTIIIFVVEAVEAVEVAGIVRNISNTKIQLVNNTVDFRGTNPVRDLTDLLRRVSFESNFKEEFAKLILT
jgi:hypothetical protein